MNTAGGKNTANTFLKKYSLNAVRNLLLRNLQGGQNTAAERAWKILKVRNRNGYMNIRNWNSAVKNLNKYDLTPNQRNIVTLTNALIKTGKPPGGGDRHRLHPNTFKRFKSGELSGQSLINQMIRNSNARGGYKGRAVAKAALVGGAVALGGLAAAKYGPYVLQTIQKARNFKKNNGRVSDDEVRRLANAWKQKGFEIKDMNSFARTVRNSANTMMTPNQAKAQFNKAFRNGTISMIAGGAASSVGAAALGGAGAASRVATARKAFANVSRQAVRTRAPNVARSQMFNQVARQISKNQGRMTFGQGVQAVRRMTNSTRAGLNRARMMRAPR